MKATEKIVFGSLCKSFENGNANDITMDVNLNKLNRKNLLKVGRKHVL